MPDLIDQRVREAFMEFRDDAQWSIQAPGPDAARRVVNGRRRIATAIAAGGLAAVLIGAWAAFRPSTGAAPVASDPTTPPSIDYDESVQAAFARAQFATYDPEWAASPNSPVWWGHTIAGAVGPRIFHYPGSLPGSSITMTAACAGTGSITVRVQTVDGSAEIPVSCGDGGLPEYHTIPTVTPDQAVEVFVRGDERVTPDGAFVVVMTDPRSLAAAAALGPPPGADSVVATGTTYNPFGSGGTSSRMVGPGRYHLALHCIGDADLDVGQISVRMSIGADEDLDEVPCPAAGSRIELEVASTTGGALEITIGESGSFGYAYLISRQV